ncbi:hypothetical protein MLD38_029616 [Melastoma candidum]|uniref:Uncharacterized protein n=1 Tax=Melastoma candidum TaxID=119954 RepID=A0ACB9N8G7_9MYRT|nr:hypothetical protein MLD38_029616 [Melastoma candidum]
MVPHGSALITGSIAVVKKQFLGVLPSAEVGLRGFQYVDPWLCSSVSSEAFAMMGALTWQATESIIPATSASTNPNHHVPARVLHRSASMVPNYCGMVIANMHAHSGYILRFSLGIR